VPLLAHYERRKSINATPWHYLRGDKKNSKCSSYQIKKEPT